MRKIGIKLFGSVSLIIIATVAGTPLAGRAAPEVVAWGDNWAGQTTVPSGLSNVVGIAAGSSHSLALTAEGRVVAWGSCFIGWTNGQPSYVPMTVPSELSNAVAIAAGHAHNLALTADGRVVAWGAGGPGTSGYVNYNQINYGQSTVPSGLSNVVAVAAGYAHSLALTAEGRVAGWGWNQSGQTTVPSGLSNVVAIAVGEFHSLALTADGRVMAWGKYFDGTAAVPMTVPSGLSNVVAIAAGSQCCLALTADGRVLAWGWNDSGQTTVPDGLSDVVAIALGGGHSLALSGLPPGVAAPALVGPRVLVAADDTPFHHRIMAKNGATAYGAAGLPTGLALNPITGLITGQTAQAGTFPVVLSATNSVGSCSWTVTLFVNGPAVPGIVSSAVVLAGLGRRFSYAVVADSVPEWYGASGLPTGLAMDAQTGIISGLPVEVGDFVVSLLASNRYGLGTGSLTIRVSPVVAWGDNESGQTAVPSGLSNVVAIAAGEMHSLALTAEGRVIGWGDNWFGQTTAPSGLSNAVGIAAGYGFSLALTTEGRVVAWGTSGNGVKNVPSELGNVVAIAAGPFYSLALTAEGRVVAWGLNDFGQTTVPSGLSNVVAIAAGSFAGSHSLALTAEGRVVQWPGQTNVPSGLSNVVGIAAGAYHSLALTTEGRVVAWGANDYGQTTVPGGLSNVVAIAAGAFHSLALTSDGRVVGWGSNDDGDDNWLGQANVPRDLSNVVAIAAGPFYSLALLQQPTVPTPRLELSRGLSGLELQAQGAPGIACLLLRASCLPGPWLPAEPVTFTNSVHRLRPPDASQAAQFFRLLRK